MNQRHASIQFRSFEPRTGPTIYRNRRIKPAGMLGTTPVRQRLHPPNRKQTQDRGSRSRQASRSNRNVGSNRAPRSRASGLPARSARWRESEGWRAADPSHQSRARTHRITETERSKLGAYERRRRWGAREGRGKPSSGGRRCRASGPRRAWLPSASR